MIPDNIHTPPPPQSFHFRGVMYNPAPPRNFLFVTAIICCIWRLSTAYHLKSTVIILRHNKAICISYTGRACLIDSISFFSLSSKNAQGAKTELKGNSRENYPRLPFSMVSYGMNISPLWNFQYICETYFFVIFSKTQFLLQF